MEILLVIPPRDSKWWLMRPEFFAFIDKIRLDPDDYRRLKDRHGSSGYHKVLWDRLSALVDDGMVEIADIPVSFEKAKLEASETLRRILKDKRAIGTFIEDVAFSYRYWIDYNKQKLDLLPKEASYGDEILRQIPVWEEDLRLIERMGSGAFEEKPEILSQGTINVLSRVHLLRQADGLCPGLPMTSLKEYEPFLKYIDLSSKITLLTEHSRVVSRYNPKVYESDSGNHMGLNPDIDFLNYRMSKKTFIGRLHALWDNYKESRTVLRELQSRALDVALCLSEAKLTNKVTTEFLRVNQLLKDEASKTKKRSKYLSWAFFGLSFIPVPGLSQLFSTLCQGAKNLGQRIESLRLYEKGFSFRGTTAYYSFLESLMDIRRLSKFPDVPERENDSGKDKLFWRMDK